MTNGLSIVILAAGGGTRLGRPGPKTLTTLADGQTILNRQMTLLRKTFGRSAPICVVVGFKADHILEAAAKTATFAYNELFDQTNTARSLLRALNVVGDGGVLWLNGDVVFEPNVLTHLAPFIVHEQNFVAVNQAAVSDEEIKYVRNVHGHISALSKHVAGAEGEALGINYIAASDRARFVAELEGCEEHDYFERAIETSVAAGVRFLAVDISAYCCVEVDFETDLEAANCLVESSTESAAP